MVNIECLNCGKGFSTWPSRIGRTKFCSQACNGLYGAKQREIKYGAGWIKTSCAYCGKAIVKMRWYAKKKHKSYCSNKCKSLGQIKHIVKACPVCGGEFFIRPSEAERSKGKVHFCSKGCYRIDWAEKQKGENNPNWNGGVSPEIKKLRETRDGKAWKRAILYKDNYTCQNCGKRGGTLNAHHIKNFITNPELMYDINNGTTYCVKCHKEHHKKNGKPQRPN